MNVLFEFGLKQVNKKREELCGDSVEFSRKPDWATLVFSDGLGSGVKASILSTLTTRIAARMLDEGLPLDEVVRTVSETLPICRERKIAYSTFAMARLYGEGRADLAAYDSPPPLLIRHGRLEQLANQECQIANKSIHEYAFGLAPGDWLVLVSDGVINAGIGGAYPLGWGWDRLGRYLEGHVHEGLSAESLAGKVATVVKELYEGPPGDDVSIAVIKVRHRRVVGLLTGPPIEERDDHLAVEALMAVPGQHIVCGGTTANIVARALDQEITVDLATGTDEVPARGRIEGIDLVTEGTLTITKALEILRVGEPVEKLDLKVDGASSLAVLLHKADEVHILVGRAINPAHQNPNLPQALGLKGQVVRALGEELERRGKDVSIRYF